MRFSFVTAFILSAFTSVAQSKAIISGTILNSRSDSVTIIYGESGRSGGSKIVKVPLVNNKFRQILRIPYLHSIEVTDGAGYVTGFIEPNDDIKIEADFASNTSKPKFDGKGKEKSIYYQSYRSYAPLLRSRVAEAKLESQPIDYMLKIVDSLTNKLSAYLDNFRPTLSSDAYNFFKGDLYGYLWALKYQIPLIIYGKTYAELIKSENIQRSVKFEQQYNSIFNTNELYYRSPQYSIALSIAMEQKFLKLYPNQESDIVSKYKYISNGLPNKLKAPVIAKLLTPDIKTRKNKESLRQIITSSFRGDPEAKKHFMTMVAMSFMLSVGDPAPDFSLTDTKGQKVSLATFKNKVVYTDFWFADCPPCHGLFKKTQPVKGYFKNNADVVFLTISIDQKNLWLSSIDKFKVEGFHVYTEGKGGEHPVIRDYQVYDYPSTRLIDKSGKFFSVAPPEDPEQLKSLIEQALANRQ